MAFRSLFRAYHPLLCGYVRSYVRAADVAEELVQDVFLRIWDRRATWTPARGIRAYLFSACRSQALDHVKHERVVARVIGEAARDGRALGSGQLPSRPDRDIEVVEFSEALHEEVHGLPERRRLVFVLRWQHGMSHAEIGRTLGISTKGAETQYGRAMATLRDRLARFH